ncbi:MAG: glucuronate isomerase [Gemmatimonadaceae bacterium]
MTPVEDRFFDADPEARRTARALYESIRQLPLICPHGHVDAGVLATNEQFPEPTALLITPDHYVLRMLYSQGVPLESLGIPSRDGARVESDPRRIWQTFATHYYLFRGTPTRAWMDYELREVFGIGERLDAETGMAIYYEIAEKLASPEFYPRALFERFNIEALATTDRATDDLANHCAIQQSGWHGRVIPTFRPDALFSIASQGWLSEVRSLGSAAGMDIVEIEAFLAAIENRRAFFRSTGATATDHGVVTPRTERLPDAELRHVFARALAGEATIADQSAFEAHMLLEMARMSVSDGLVMQLHAGAFRDHNDFIAARFGADKGADIPVAAEFTRNLRPLLNDFGNDSRFTLILFTLDEATYSRELAPLAGHYPAVRLGPPWWFHDSIEGMRRFREQTTGTAGIYNTAGFNDDTRAFCSIPARHDLARRMDANFLAGLVIRHIVALDEAHEMAHALAYDLARKTYRLDQPVSGNVH